MDFEDNMLRDAQKEYLDFLDDKDTDRDGIYFEKVNEMIRQNKKRLIINLNHLRRKNEKRVSFILNSAFTEIFAFQRALRDYIGNLDSIYARRHHEFFIGFEGSLGSRLISPRQISSRNLNNLVCLDGIVTKCSLVYPKIIKSVHYCPSTMKSMERRYSDFSSIEGQSTGSAYPVRDADGNLLESEHGLSFYKDHQSITLQEMPECSPAGQLPRSIDILLDDDLVDLPKPGDRIQVVGTYRCLPVKHAAFASGSFKTVLIANNISIINKENSPLLSSSDVSKIRRLSKQANIFDLLSKSLAPSIAGHDFIKKAILCLILGGVEKLLNNGTRLRGDINILLIGDPSTAKSQLLRYVHMIAPRSVSTTGRGSSGVGLTAAVTTDQETGERRLEAGAMVLADRGIVCIDEFDKMNDIDRTAIHEVMEQGTVTIAKAGIHAKLNARCSVLAAANPVYGRYDEYQTPMDNIGLQDSLLSRFDLIFIVLDNMCVENDRKVAEHVIRSHRYRNPCEDDGVATVLGNEENILALENLSSINLNNESKADKPIYEKHNCIGDIEFTSDNKDKYLTKEFTQKYIHVAKAMRPVLTTEACDMISRKYTELRSQDLSQTDVAKTQPVTARTLESLIRIATAHAKARISKTINIQDVEAAIDLIYYAYFKEVVQKGIKATNPMYNDIEYDTQNIISNESYELNSCTYNLNSTLPFASYSNEKQEVFTSEQLLKFKELLHSTFEKDHVQSMKVDYVYEISVRNLKNIYNIKSIENALRLMQNDNQVMISDGVVYLI